MSCHHTRSSHIFDSRNMLGELPCAGEDAVVPRVTQRKFISSSNLRPENLLRAILLRQSAHGIILNSVSTLVPPVSFGNILDDGFVISDSNAS